MIILDGKKARDFYRAKLIERVKVVPHLPTLAIIQVGDNRESTLYIKQKKLFAESIGARVLHICFGEDVSEAEIAAGISELNVRSDVGGIIIQLPLPQQFDKLRLINLIDPKKDVDGLTDENQKLLEKGTPRFVPATAKGVLMLLDFYGITVRGVKAAVVGRSRLVGHPVAELLKTRGAHVAVCHSKTPNTQEITRGADLVIVAIGKPELIDASYIKEGAVVIDVGINSFIDTAVSQKLEEELPRRKVVGDVNHASVAPIVGALTPVPGGVGPMTVMALFDNLITPASRGGK